MSRRGKEYGDIIKEPLGRLVESFRYPPEKEDEVKKKGRGGRREREALYNIMLRRMGY